MRSLHRCARPRPAKTTRTQSGTLTFVPGETSKRVRVPVLTDTITEPVEYFRLLLSSPSGGGGLTPTLGTSIATTGIVDAAGPLLGATLTVTPDSIGEGGGAATDFTVKVDLDCCTTFDEDTTVTVSLGGTATRTDDYTATVANVTIPASTATGSATLSITPVDDSVYEGKETIVVKGSLTGFVVFPDTIDLAENDLAHVTLSFDPEYTREGSDIQVTLTATRDGTVGNHATDWHGGWSSQTATDNTDYTQGGGGSCLPERNTDYFIRVLPSDVRIAPGESSASTSMTFHICSDDLDDPNETIVWSADVPGATVTDAVLTIGEPETIALSVSPDTITEDAGATEVTVTATMSAARPTDTVVDLTLGGAAANPADYTATTLNSITIPKGQTNATGTLTITPVDDAVPEGDETITVSGASGARTVSPTDITITDSAPLARTVSVSGPAIVMERNSATYTISLSPGAGSVPEANLTVDYATSDGSDPYLGPAAVAGTDYTAKSGTVTFTPTNAGPKTITVPILGDTEIDSGEVFTFRISNLQGGGTQPPSMGTDKVTTAILDANKDITLTANRYTIGEHEISARITLTATRTGTEGEVTITGDFPPGGTATPGALGDSQDYVIWSRWSITIPDGATSASTRQALGFTMTDDDFEEGDETIILNGRATGGLTVAPAILTVKDNDKHDITLTANRYTIGENEVAARVTLTATREGTEGAVTITGVLPPEGTAEAGALGNPKDYVTWSGCR